jgi:hypothetical protein
MEGVVPSTKRARYGLTLACLCLLGFYVFFNFLSAVGLQNSCVRQFSVLHIYSYNIHVCSFFLYFGLECYKNSLILVQTEEVPRFMY